MVVCTIVEFMLGRGALLGGVVVELMRNSERRVGVGVGVGVSLFS